MIIYNIVPWRLYYSVGQVYSFCHILTEGLKGAVQNANAALYSPGVGLAITILFMCVQIFNYDNDSH